ncbi:MAG: hypothetical protein ACYTGE_15005, partial [Planctomycetota bacterium]
LQSTWSGLKPAGDFYAFIVILPVDEDISDLGVVVSGKKVNIKIYPSLTNLRVIVELSHFIPEPQS